MNRHPNKIIQKARRLNKKIRVGNTVWIKINSTEAERHGFDAIPQGYIGPAKILYLAPAPKTGKGIQVQMPIIIYSLSWMQDIRTVFIKKRNVKFKIK